MQMQIEVEEIASEQSSSLSQYNDSHNKSIMQQQQQIKNKDVKNVNIAPSSKIDSLKFLRDKIELLTAFHQIEILRILHTNKVTFSENKNGVFVNLTYVSSDIIDTISEYIVYVYKQESQLNEIEEKKIVLSNQYFK
jgi:ribosomal protein S17E